MLTCPLVHLILQSKGQKVPKSGSFKNEILWGVDSGRRSGRVRLYPPTLETTMPTAARLPCCWPTSRRRISTSRPYCKIALVGLARPHKD